MLLMMRQISTVTTWPLPLFIGITMANITPQTIIMRIPTSTFLNFAIVIVYVSLPASRILSGFAVFGRAFLDKFPKPLVACGQVFFAKVHHVAAPVAFPLHPVF